MNYHIKLNVFAAIISNFMALIMSNQSLIIFTYKLRMLNYFRRARKLLDKRTVKVAYFSEK